MQVKLQVKQKQKLKTNLKLLIGVSASLLVFSIAFFWFYFNSGYIDDVVASHKGKYTGTHSVEFTQNKPGYFKSGNINNDLFALSFWVYTPNSYTGGENYNGRTLGMLEKNGTMAFGATSHNIPNQTFTIGEKNAATAITSKIPKGWNHIAINWNTNSQAYDIYLNGKKQSTKNGKKRYSRPKNFEAYFGQQGPNGSNYYGGIDEIAFWNQSLSDSLIKALPYKALEGTEIGLEAYYRFNHGSGNTISDLTTNNNDGSLDNTSAWRDSSGAVIGDSLSQAQWNTRGLFVNKTNSGNSGELTIAGNPPKDSNLVFGHDAKTGVTSNDQPTSKSYANFIRINRSWYMNPSGQDLKGDLTFDISGLLDAYQNSNYILLKRDNLSQNFEVAVGVADQQFGDYLKFKQVGLEEGYYTVGVKDTSSSNIGGSLAKPADAGKAIDFDGSGEANFPTIANEDMRALEFWVYTPNTFNGDETFNNRFIGSPASNVEMVFGQASGPKNTSTLTIQDGNGATYTNASITSGWHHITFNWENGNYMIYIDGVAKATNHYNKGKKPCGLISDPELILGKIFGSGDYYKGKIDQLAMWNTTLTQQDIRNHMCQRLNGNEVNLIGLWHFDNGIAGTALDYKGSNDANLIGGVSKAVSGASLGKQAKYVHGSSNWANESLKFEMANGDTFLVNNITGSPDQIQVYTIDTVPNYTNMSGGLQSINEFHHFGVRLIGDPSATYDVTYNYNVSVQDETALDLASRASNAESTWSKGGATVNTLTNTITLPNQSGTQYVMASSNSEPLPVEMTYFEADYKENAHKARLEWATASETQNKGFNIQRSTDGQSFDSIGFAEGRGTSTESHKYQFTDRQLPVSVSSVYYRLKQKDLDGGHEYSNVKSIELGDKTEQSVKLYPNPFREKFTVEVTLDNAASVQMWLFDQNGNVMENRKARLRKGSNNYEYRLSEDLDRGIYFLRIESSEFQKHLKVVKG